MVVKVMASITWNVSFKLIKLESYAWKCLVGCKQTHKTYSKWKEERETFYCIAFNQVYYYIAMEMYQQIELDRYALATTTLRIKLLYYFIIKARKNIFLPKK